MIRKQKHARKQKKKCSKLEINVVVENKRKTTEHFILRETIELKIKLLKSL